MGISFKSHLKCGENTMATKKILVTGGAGFIGSHLVDRLIQAGHQVTVFDSLDSQIHPQNEPPTYLNPKAIFLRGDVRHLSELENALQDIEIIYHLAAAVGVGQSMYQIDRFVETNTSGTAKLLDLVVNKPNKVQKIIIASSNTIYGEGKGICPRCGPVFPKLRPKSQLERKDWEVRCPHCNEILKPCPTDETTPANCTSIYALAKKDQEDMAMMIGNAYGINTTVFRFFLVYGSRQALSNPYTGVCAIFSTNLLNGNPPQIYEDGNQSRDFVHVDDVCQGLMLGMTNSAAKHEIFNIGSGEKITIREVAEILAEKINPKIHPKITQQFRSGDIRHCLSDISKISTKLGYKPKYTFRMGIGELIDWVKNLDIPIQDRTAVATKELEEKGLLKKAP
jgi:dTDP-L-rhamnose 4-epimerase